jgi:hypothetical protein
MRPRFLRPHAAVVLAALALLGQLAGFAHLGAVDHVTCEHGELVDLDRHATPAVAAHHDHESAFHADSAAQGREHEHCFVSAMRRERAAVAAHATAPRLLTCDRPRAASAPRCDVAAPIPLLALAPKSSPPTV